jgi:heterodisulfide reductase subunit C
MTDEHAYRVCTTCATCGQRTMHSTDVAMLIRSIRRVALRGTITRSIEKATLAADILDLTDKILDELGNEILNHAPKV